MRRLITILTILSVQISALGQMYNFGIKANPGLSYISTKFKSPGSTAQTFYFMPSGQCGLFFNFQGKQWIGKSSLGAELLFIQIDGKEHSTSPETDLFGNPTGGYMIENIERHISYIGIPIYYGFKLKKWTFNLGVQTTYAVKSSGHYITQYSYNGTTVIDDKKYNKLYIDNFDFGAMAGIIFNLSDKFSIDGTYYYGINNILKGKAQSDWKWRVQQITIGLRYKLFTIRQKNETEN